MKNKDKSNSLINSGSPYLLKHAYNPVDWLEWGPSALERAKRENKMIFLSIGYTACHWCNELEKECFDHQDFADVINPRFICVKVDREQRPDLDRIYMEAAMALQGHGGWPNNLFLTPELDPVYALGYQRRGAFKKLLLQINDYWIKKSASVMDEGKRISKALADHLERGGDFGKPGPLDLAGPRKMMDLEYGGFGHGTKFPMTAILEFLLTEGSDDEFLIKTLDNMSRGGMFDHVGGGFHRYTTDREWIIPHFEKMLYDNALLAPLYARAGALLGRNDYSTTARRTLDFIHAELRNPEGGLLSSLDADSDGEEGKYYLWPLDEFMEITKDKMAADALGVTADGNMFDLEVVDGAARKKSTGKSVIHLKQDGDYEAVFKKLLTERNKRKRPMLDDKVVASWHSMAVSAFARGGILLDDPEQIDRAGQAAQFTLKHLKFAHSWREGEASGDANLEDAAYAALAFWDLFEATGKEEYLAAARQYSDYANDNFSAGDGGYFIVGRRDDLIARPRAGDDNPTPNPAAILGLVDLNLSVALREPARKKRAQATADHLMGALGGAGYHSGQAMSLFRESYAEQSEIVYSFAEGEPNRLSWLRAGHVRCWGVVRIPIGAPSLHPSLAEGRRPASVSAAHVCKEDRCLEPSFAHGEIAKRLNGCNGGGAG